MSTSGETLSANIPTAGEQVGAKPSFQVAALASAGAAVEWYDFFLYGTAAALVFPKLFFPADMPPLVAQIASFSTFVVGFIARPVGASIFGHLGDLHGRKRALVLAMIMMGLSTTFIGLTPSYEVIGSLAPLLLVVMRFVQGLAVGGQWGGAALMALETAPENRRGFFSSFVQVGVPLGVVLANTVFLIASAITDTAQFMAWGWRIGFVLSILLIVIALRIHRTVDETPPVENDRVERERSPSPVFTVLRHHWRVVLLAGGAFIANNVCFYIAITFAVAYGTATLGISRDLLLFAVMAGSVAMIPALIACGAASDRFGRRTVFMLGTVLCGAWAFVLMPLIETGSPASVTAGIAVMLLFVSMMYGPQAALFAEMFPRHIRYSGASLGYQIGTVFGGGFAPIIATALFAEFASSVAISIYLAAVCAISLACIIALGSRASTYANQ